MHTVLQGLGRQSVQNFNQEHPRSVATTLEILTPKTELPASSLPAPNNATPYSVEISANRSQYLSAPPVAPHCRLHESRWSNRNGNHILASPATDTHLRRAEQVRLPFLNVNGNPGQISTTSAALNTAPSCRLCSMPPPLKLYRAGTLDNPLNPLQVLTLRTCGQFRLHATMITGFYIIEWSGDEGVQVPGRDFSG